MVFLGAVLPTQTAFAHDAPVIAPTTLDFDASQAPKACNDGVTFQRLLGNWITDDLLTLHADRKLIVRIRRSPTGEKLVDVTLEDAAGVRLGERHQRYGATAECHKVLHDSAEAAARLMGAFDIPPPSEPLVCPTPPAPAKPEPCPTCVAPGIQMPRITLPAPFISRASIGAGVFLGMTTRNDVSLGPSISLGFAPFSQGPGFRIEFDGAWISRKSPQGFPMDTVPFFASVCHSHDGLRLCGGLVSTFYSVDDPKDARDFTMSASLRIGTEFAIAGPISIRTDVFALLPLTQRITRDAPEPIAAGTVVMGVWGFE